MAGQPIIHEGRPAALIDGKIYPLTKCRLCGRNICFVPTEKGRLMPTNVDGSNHFATCPAKPERKK